MTSHSTRASSFQMERNVINYVALPKRGFFPLRVFRPLDQQQRLTEFVLFKLEFSYLLSLGTRERTSDNQCVLYSTADSLARGICFQATKLSNCKQYQTGYEGIIKLTTELWSHYLRIIYKIKIHAELHKLNTYVNNKPHVLHILDSLFHY